MFKVGDIVKIIKYGQTYSSYLDNKSRTQNAKYISGFAPRDGENYQIKKNRSPQMG